MAADPVGHGDARVTPEQERARAHEQRRQQALLDALARRPGPGPVDPPLAPWMAPAGLARGLAAYRANAAATAARTLAAAYPTVALAVGPDALAALARALWAQEAPRRGDLAEWGGTLAAFIDADPLDDAPWLADLARLDWAVQGAERAADEPSPVDPAALAPLADTDPDVLRLRWRAGTAVVTSRWPIVTLRAAHAGSAAERAAVVPAALVAAGAEAALVWRRGWQVEVTAISAAEAAFTAHLLAGATLGQALQRGGAGWADGTAFEAWLLAQVRRDLLHGADRVAASAP